MSWLLPPPLQPLLLQMCVICMIHLQLRINDVLVHPSCHFPPQKVSSQPHTFPSSHTFWLFSLFSKRILHPRHWNITDQHRTEHHEVLYTSWLAAISGFLLPQDLGHGQERTCYLCPSGYGVKETENIIAEARGLEILALGQGNRE